MFLKSILKVSLAKLRFGNTNKKPETHFSMFVNVWQEANPVNVPGSIENKQSNRLGFMQGEGRVPDDFNTMGAREIENLFLNGR
jgi:hypothetical protein